MISKARVLTRPVLAGVLVLLGLASFGSAVAQTAKDVKCKRCVGTSDLAKKAVKGINIRNNSITSSKIADGTITADDIAPGVLGGGQNGNGSDGDKAAFDTEKMTDGEEFTIGTAGGVSLVLKCIFDEFPPNDNGRTVDAQLRLIAKRSKTGTSYNAVGANGGALESTGESVLIDFKTTDPNEQGQSEITSFAGSGGVHNVDTGALVSINGEGTVVSLGAVPQGADPESAKRYCRAVGTYTASSP